MLCEVASGVDWHISEKQLRDYDFLNCNEWLENWGNLNQNSWQICKKSKLLIWIKIENKIWKKNEKIKSTLSQNKFGSKSSTKYKETKSKNFGKLEIENLLTKYKLEYFLKILEAEKPIKRHKP